MVGTLIKTKDGWKIKSNKINMTVHKCCYQELNENMSGKKINYVIIKDFSTDQHGAEYALPIIDKTD